MAKFTEGEFRINGQEIRVDDGDTISIIARVFSRFHNGNAVKQAEETAANARLFGNATKMYYTLANVLHFLGSSDAEIEMKNHIGNLLKEIDG